MFMPTVLVFMRVPMLVIVHFFFLAVHGDGQVGACDAALDRRIQRHLCAGDPGIVYFCDKDISLRVREQLRQSGAQHITGRAHAAV